MTQTLNSPVYEVPKDTPLYKSKKAQKDLKDTVANSISKVEEFTGLPEFSLGVYNNNHFGIFAEHVDEYSNLFSRNDLVKNVDNNNVYLFKKNAKKYNELKELLKNPKEEELKEKVNPWLTHETFGTNNVGKSQWVGERLFFNVLDDERYKSEVASDGRMKARVEENKPKLVDYTEYLDTISEYLKERESVNG